MASSSSHGGQQGNNNGGSGGGVVVDDCAACRVHGKKCGPGCIMAPHFRGNDSGTRDFFTVENVFGLDNVRKKLEALDLANQKEVVESLKWEARLWMQHPIRGPYGYHHSMMQQQSLAMLQQHQQQLTALQRMVLREQQQQRQQQPVLLPLFPPDGHGNGRMGGHHHEDHHMTIQENNATSQANFPNPVVVPDHQQQEMRQVGPGGGSRNIGAGVVPNSNFAEPVGGGRRFGHGQNNQQHFGRSSGADGTGYDDQDGVQRAAGAGDHQHGQSHQQHAEYQHHPHVFGSEHGRADHLPGGSRKRSRE